MIVRVTSTLLIRDAIKALGSFFIRAADSFSGLINFMIAELSMYQIRNGHFFALQLTSRTTAYP